MARLEKTGLGRIRSLLTAGGEGRALSAGESHEALSLFHDFEESGQGWFWSTDADGRITYISQTVAERLGTSADALLGEDFKSLFEIERSSEKCSERTLPLIFNSRKSFSELVVRPAGTQADVWLSVTGRPQVGAGGKFLGFRGNGVDVTDSFARKRDASRLAEFDSLTGLLNRHKITNKLELTLNAYASAKRNCALMMLDLDRFKQVNDTMGHPAGDALLKQVAERLRSVIPATCDIGRLGGDEFQVILPDMEDRGELGEIAKKVIEVLAQPFSLEEGRCLIGGSVGIAIAPFDGIDLEAIVRSADLALYAAKGGGRGRFRFYSADLLMEAERRRELLEDLRTAGQHGQMRLVYQPIVDAGNQVVCLQSALRWDHPEWGDVLPSTFMPIAYESNLIDSLNEWMLRQACEDAVQWPGGVKVAVPVTATQFGNANFPTVVTQALAKSELDPKRLEIELPEAIFSSHDAFVEKQFTSLKMLGVRLVLDEFGTGYSALARLSDAPFDKIKISESFVKRLSENEDGTDPIVDAIVSVADSLNMETAGVGVETHRELDSLRNLKVRCAQGGLFSYAESLEEVIENMSCGAWIIEPSGPQRFRDDRMSVLRKVGLIHEDYRYEVRLRNLSRSGCLVEGLLSVPVGTQFVVDFGNGQLAVASVQRSSESQQGLEFELPLVDDGAGGLVTRNRVSPYALAAAGMPLGALPAGSYPLDLVANKDAQFNQPKFAQVEVSG